MRVHGVVPWLRANMFSSVGNSILSIVGIIVAVLVIVPLVQWAFINAVWDAPTRDACAITGSPGAA